MHAALRRRSCLHAHLTRRSMPRAPPPPPPPPWAARGRGPARAAAASPRGCPERAPGLLTRTRRGRSPGPCRPAVRCIAGSAGSPGWRGAGAARAGAGRGGGRPGWLRAAAALRRARAALRATRPRPLRAPRTGPRRREGVTASGAPVRAPRRAGARAWPPWRGGATAGARRARGAAARRRGRFRRLQTPSPLLSDLTCCTKAGWWGGAAWAFTAPFAAAPRTWGRGGGGASESLEARAAPRGCPRSRAAGPGARVAVGARPPPAAGVSASSGRITV
jgi:hypothetical protein